MHYAAHPVADASADDFARRTWAKVQNVAFRDFPTATYPVQHANESEISVRSSSSRLLMDRPTSRIRTEALSQRKRRRSQTLENRPHSLRHLRNGQTLERILGGSELQQRRSESIITQTTLDRWTFERGEHDRFRQ